MFEILKSSRTGHTPIVSAMGMRPAATASDTVAAVKDITISMESDAELPPVVCNKLICYLPPKVQKQYNDFERTLKLEEHDITAINEGVLTGKLLQLANGS